MTDAGELHHHPPPRRMNPSRVFYIQGGVQAFAAGVAWTLYTVYYAASVGMNPLQLVLVGTVLEATALLFEVPTGVVADVYSRRLSVIVGMFILGAGFIITGSFPIFWVILLAQVVMGIGYTFLSGAMDAWLADEVGEANVGPIYIRSGQVNRLAGLAGVAVSVALGSLRLNIPFLAGGALYLLLGVFLVLFMGETGFTPAPQSSRSPWQAMGGIFRSGLAAVRFNPLLISLAAVTFFIGAASEGFDRLGDAHLLKNFTFPALGPLQPVAWFGLLSAGESLIGLLATELFRPRLEKASRSSTVTAGALLVFNFASIASVLTFALAGSFWLAVAALLVKAVFRSLSSPLYSAWLVQQIDSRVRATVLSMVSQTDALGQVIAGPGVGAVGTLVSLRAALAVTGALLLPNTWLFASVLRKSRKQGREGFAAQAPEFNPLPAGVGLLDESPGSAESISPVDKC